MEMGNNVARFESTVGRGTVLSTLSERKSEAAISTCLNCSASWNAPLAEESASSSSLMVPSSSVASLPALLLSRCSRALAAAEQTESAQDAVVRAEGGASGRRGPGPPRIVGRV